MVQHHLLLYKQYCCNSGRWFNGTNPKITCTCTTVWAYNGYCNDSRIILDGSTGTNNRQTDKLY
jgi:hypothetical protein